MIEIDGSYGEGGGQILRTSLTLSVLTGKPLRIYNIRSRRKPPGLKPQHLMSARTAASISNGRLTSAALGATELTLHPGPIRPGAYTFDVGSVKASAGSTSLIFQTLLPPLGFADGPSHVIIKGGTHVTLSPPADYIREVFLPTLRPMGLPVRLENPSKGFYPIGMGILDGVIEPFRTPLKPLRIEARGALKHLRILSAVARLPVSIAQRQLDRAIARLTEKGFHPEGKIEEATSPGKGTYCFILAEFENVRAGFSALGEIGKRAERVADEAVDPFLHYWNGKGALDPHLADQTPLYMALAEGESAITTTKASEHLRTNLWVIEQFLPVKFVLKEETVGGGGALSVTGIALSRKSD